MTQVPMSEPAEVPVNEPADVAVNAHTVQRTRSWTGLYAVIIGNAGIASAAIWGVAQSPDSSPMVAILTSAFTAMGTLTTAYFGIRAVSNSVAPAAP